MLKPRDDIITQDINSSYPLFISNIFRYSLNHDYNIELSPVEPELYNSFLRLNNRRKTQGGDDFKKAGYFNVSNIDWKNANKANQWCVNQFGKNGYFSEGYNEWWFVTKEDAMMFTMTWM